MGAFSAEWLALREPADTAARSSGAARAVVARAMRVGDTARIVDLAAGTGANVRYLAGHFAAVQEWLLVDLDADLLARVPACLATWAHARGYDAEAAADADAWLVRAPAFACRISTRRWDLRRAVEDAALYEGRSLVTASALLDLVSRQWLETLARACADHRVAVLFALNYDGRMECTPEDGTDAEVRDLVNRHQRTDKGFGPALGPDAAEAARRCLAGVGFEVSMETSDWRLGPDAAELQRRLIEGWAEAAAAMAPERGDAIGAWRNRRLDHVQASRSHLLVGHVDVAAWPRQAPIGSDDPVGGDSD